MAKFYIQTYGCKLNQADSEIIRDILKKDFEEAGTPKAADFVVLNSCGVLQKTERRVLNRARELKEKGKKVIITGCLPLISPRKCKKAADGIAGPKSITYLPEVAKMVLEGKKTVIIKEKSVDKAKFCLFGNKKDSCSVIIPICEGCLGNCTYCAAKLARGRLMSFGMENILNQVKLALSFGFREIQLTGQDLTCYGQDSGEPLLPELLRKITELEGNFRIKVGMLEPYLLKKILNDLVIVCQNEKIYNFFHIPVQSGDNEVSAKMSRKYKREDFLEIVEFLDKNLEDYLLSTDAIVGFPGETEKAFENTLNLLKQTKPQVVNINRFSKRPGTKGSILEDLPDRIKKDRSRILNKLCEDIKIQESREYVGKEYKALIVQKGKNNTFLARNEIGKAIILKEGRVGEFKKVRITDLKPNYLIGQPI